MFGGGEDESDRRRWKNGQRELRTRSFTAENIRAPAPVPVLTPERGVPAPVSLSERIFADTGYKHTHYDNQLRTP